MSARATASGARLELRRFIGVSLGGGRGKTTAVARLELDSITGALTLAEARARWGQRGGGEVAKDDDEHGEAAFRDDVLLRWLGDWVDEQSVVAFDAPLTMPPCVRCQLACPGIDACEVPVVVWMRNHAGRLSIRSGRSDPSKPAVTPYTQRATEAYLWHRRGILPVLVELFACDGEYDLSRSAWGLSGGRRRLTIAASGSRGRVHARSSCLVTKE